MKASYKNTVIVIALFLIACFIGKLDENQYQKEQQTQSEQITVPALLFDKSAPVYVQTMAEPEHELFIPVELDLLSRVIFTEAGNQSYRGKLLVAATIRNRYRTGNYRDLCAVVYQQGQYATPRELPTITTPQELKQLEECKQAVIEVLNSDDTYGGVMYFCNPRISDPVSLRWFESELELVCVEGEHYFYRERVK
jgi:spore germination cell wall hydrolase CwlJ-like protein